MGWMGENSFAAVPVALCGTASLLAAVAYYILAQVLIAYYGQNSTLAIAIGRDRKGKISVVIYAVAIPLACGNSGIACALSARVAILWLILDRRIENTLTL